MSQARAGEPKLQAMVLPRAAAIQGKLKDARAKVKQLSAKMKRLQAAHGKMQKKINDAKLVEASLRQAIRQEAAAERSKLKPIKNVTKTLKKLRGLVPKKLNDHSFLTVDEQGVVHAVVQPNIEYLPCATLKGLGCNGYRRWP